MRTTLGCLVLALLPALSGCAGDGGEVPPDAPPVTGVTEISMRNLRFSPQVVQVPPRTTITWKFDDGSVPHNVKGDGFASRNQDKGTFEHTFGRAGTFDYRCDLHAGMTGRVIVR